MLKAAICLENAGKCRTISGIIEKTYLTEKSAPFGELKIRHYTQSSEFFEAHESYDLVILGTYLEEGNGFSVGTYLWQKYKDTSIIMIRGNEDPVRIINQTHCFGIIDRGKASGLTELLEAFFLLHKRRGGIQPVAVKKEDRSIRFVNPADIAYLCTIPGRKNRIELHFPEVHRTLVVMGAKGKTSALFEEQGFVKLSRSHTVNPEWVKKIKREYTDLKNGEILTIPHKRFSEVKEKMMEYWERNGYNEEL